MRPPASTISGPGNIAGSLFFATNSKMRARWALIRGLGAVMRAWVRSLSLLQMLSQNRRGCAPPAIEALTQATVMLPPLLSKASDCLYPNELRRKATRVTLGKVSLSSSSRLPVSSVARMVMPGNISARPRQAGNNPTRDWVGRCSKDNWDRLWLRPSQLRH